MPKSSEKNTATWPFRLLYESVEKMPWGEIEASVKREFSQKERREVFECTKAYSVLCSKHAASASVTDVEKLREKFLKPVKELLALIEHYRPESGPDCPEEDETVYLALQDASVSDQFVLTKALRDVRPSLQKISSELSRIRKDRQPSSLSPEVMGLAGFIAGCIAGAEETPAKSNPGYLDKPKYFERRRWDLLLSPKRGDIPEFATAVLGRRVTHKQVQHAFKVIRKNELIRDGHLNLGAKLITRPKHRPE